MARLDVTETFHGITFPGHLHTQDSLQSALRFPFQDTDILIVSYPKSGTTWMQEIVTLICNRGDPHVCQTVPNWTRAPWLEQHYCAMVLEKYPLNPRVITTHLPQHLLEPALQGSKAKVIYVSRNPKDVVVSYYHFCKMAKFFPDPGSFQDFLNQFLDGRCELMKSWQNFFFFNLKVTLALQSIKSLHFCGKISAFLQRPLVEEELNSCLKHSSFSSMKNNTMVNCTLISPEIMDHSKGCFMRKGELGNWKSLFTDEQNQHFESVFSSRMQDCSLKFVWDVPHENRICNKEGNPN
uniref:Sulfotransferase n=1 Tax=Myripristis murdjan TaxID=586833 RepID=A0A667XVB5_9TELE